MRKQFITLLKRYSEIRDELMEYTMTYFDEMGYDIEGYACQLDCENFDEIDDLRNQVESFELILQGLSKLKYIFG